MPIRLPRSGRVLPVCVLAWLLAAPHGAGAQDDPATRFRLATFQADVTVPLGHRLMGVLPAKAREIVDPLEARGFVLLGAGNPVVVVAVDWCEIRNDSYDAWRSTLAAAAATTPERVLVSSLHQHDAPVVDGRAQELLDGVGLEGELFDAAFHRKALGRVMVALSEALASARPVTHIGLGEAFVEEVASNRRIVAPDGVVSFRRGSASGADPACRSAPEGLVDPWLKTLSFWSGEMPLLALHAYATHPMSYYGRGGVSADFVGMARRRRQEDHPDVFQMYVTGASGDVTAGKYNDGAEASRPRLAERLHRAMVAAWEATRRHALAEIALRSTKLELEFIAEDDFSEASLRGVLADPQRETSERILAAMGLSTRERLSAGRAIDLPCLDLGAAQLVLLPGEAFVGYQLLAQALRPGSLVVTAGYGECWTGYIPTAEAFADGFAESWRWVAAGAESRMRDALARVLLPQAASPPGGELDFEVELETLLRHDDGEWLWFHPRAAAVPSAGGDAHPSAVLTIQKHLRVSDYYSGLWVHHPEEGGASWSAPREIPELGWVTGTDDVTVAVADVTPGWHPQAKRLLAVGAQVRYSPAGRQLEDVPRAHQTAYAVHDPASGSWSRWRRLEMPEVERFDFARSACAQWLVRPDGRVLLPFYFGPSAKTPFSTTVVECHFDGQELRYLRHGSEHSLDEARGLYEPSLAEQAGRYFLTIRNDLRGYVTRSDDGLHFEDVRPWRFDDGADLGSYNTQQHWLVHSEALFLVYTRRGANNDHVRRHRAPLFIGRVDPDALHVVRSSERVLVPERGATLGNFGVAAIDARESWVTVSEGVFGNAREHGADGSTYLARVHWSRPTGVAKRTYAR